MYESFVGNKDIKIFQLKQSGSYRQYYRIISNDQTLLAVYNPDQKENQAFLAFTENFADKNLRVPAIIKRFDKENIYFIQDLGDITLFDFLQQNPDENQIIKIYKKILNNLIEFQFRGINGLDTTKCYPRDIFDKQSIMWDLNYFKYFVLKVARITFDEQKLEQDFCDFADFLTSAPMDYFLYRDFQSKNIMLFNDKLYFIDYQGGRKGAVYYDLASLLFDSKANLSEKVRNNLIEYYFDILNKKTPIDRKTFDKFFDGYALVRVLQAFGAYGFRGLVERKQHFIASIPKAVKNIKYFLDNSLILKDLNELRKSLDTLTNSDLTKMFSGFSSDLTIKINSFSFIKSGYPKNTDGNGGGFVFDCRFLPNPGRIEFYKKMTGLDKPVIEFLEGIPQVETFISDVVKMVVNAAKSYSERKYTALQVSFGCTGGQHRSVYSAQKTAQILKNLYGLNVQVEHINLGISF